ncbi:MAG: hypothetical protein WKH64_06435 [Chloroflexia bacterium]
MLRLWMEIARPRGAVANPVFVLSDLDLGMNLRMTRPFEYPDQPLDRGKVLSAEDVNARAASLDSPTPTATG